MPQMGVGILLAGLLTVSIPIIIHLLHRQKTKPLQWGAMMFLKESPLQMKRRKQVDHWLLLLLRMGVLALLAWLLARPLFNAPHFSPLGANQAVDVAVVIDHSLSMGRHHDDHTLFDEAVGVVDRLSDPQGAILHGGDTLSVVLAEHRPVKLKQAEHANDLSAMSRVRTELHAMKPGMTDCSIPEAIEAAREVVSHGPNVRKIVLVISDEQKTNWNVGDLAAWQRARGDDLAGGLDRPVEIHSYPLIADNSTSNISVEGITVSPETVGVDRPVQITARISNSGPREVTSLNIHFSADNKEDGAPQIIQSIGANQSVTVRFDHTFSSAGSTWVKVWTDVVDSLSADNQAVAAIHVWQKLPVLVVDGQLNTTGNFKSSMFLNLAMQPVDPDHPTTALIQPKVISVTDCASVNLNDYYVVVLNDVPQLPNDMQDKLAEYVSGGHGLWVILGPHSSPSFVHSLSVKSLDQAHVLFTADLKQPTPHEEKGVPATVEIKDPNNPMVQVVASGQRNALAGAVATKWWAILPQDSDNQVVLASTSGDPLIVGRPLGAGQVVVWATSVDGNWNNWPMMPNFVPLVNETINQLSAAQTHRFNSDNLDAGASITWSGPPAPSVQVVDITLPDGTVDRGRKANFRSGHYEFTYPNAFLPGLYQLRFDPTDVPQPVFYGVGIDHRELDNTPLTRDDADWLTTHNFLDKEKPRVDSSSLGASITRKNEGIDIWVYLAGFVVLSLFLETYMTFRMAGLQKKIDVAGAGLFKV